MCELLEAALDYQRAGLPITLCRGKVPIGRDWPNKEWSLKGIEEAFQKQGDLNVGMRLGPAAGLVDIEEDGPGAGGILADLFDGDVPVTPSFASRRGQHRFFAWDPKLEAIGKSTLEMGGLEIRVGGNGKGIQSLLPPSTTDGFTRKWLVPQEDCPPARLPESVVDRLLEGGGRNGCQEMPQRGHSMSSVLSDLSVFSVTNEVQDAIRTTQPGSSGHRHRKIFQFARHLKAIAALADADFDSLRPYVEQWHLAALPFIRTKPFEETWMDFIEGWDKVMFPAGKEPILQTYQQALARVPPACAGQYEQPALKSLVALCRELQQVAGQDPFYLAGRTAAVLIGREHGHTARWLNLLVKDKILEIVTKGTTRRATRFRYLGD